MCVYVCKYIRGGTIHVFVPNRHSTGLSVRCMRSYNEYRQYTPNPVAPTAMHRCLITGSRTTNARSCALENKAWVLITAESNVNYYCLINNASLYKSVLLFVYNPGKQNNVLFVNCNLYYCLFKINKKILSIDFVFPDTYSTVTSVYRA